MLDFPAIDANGPMGHVCQKKQPAKEPVCEKKGHEPTNRHSGILMKKISWPATHAASF
jgi:hypothetical protein